MRSKSIGMSGLLCLLFPFMRKRRGKLSKNFGRISRFAQGGFQPGAGKGPFLLGR